MWQWLFFLGEKSIFLNFLFIIMNVYAFYFIDLLVPDSASMCAQIHLPVKSSVPKSHVFDASANWE